MICCLNPDCDRPINPDSHAHCQTCGTPLVPLLKGFKVIEPIGRGGFGKTYLAENTSCLNKRCVVKQLAYQGQSTWAAKKALELFQQEAEQLAQLGEDAQIPTLLAYFQEDNYFYLVQQFIEGENLLKQLEKQGKYSEAQIQQLLFDLLPVLEFIHNQGVIHRDIKPENIMRRYQDNKGYGVWFVRLCYSYITRLLPSFYPVSCRLLQPAFSICTHNKPILIDFGVAKLLSQTAVATSHVGTSIGSHGYSPLEQIQDGKAVYASDLFALGVTCFHLLSDIHPFSMWTEYGYGWMSDWRKYISNPVSLQFGHILDKLLQKNVQDRYQCAKDVLQDLQVYTAALVSTPVLAPTVQFSPSQSSKFPVSEPLTTYQNVSADAQVPKKSIPKMALLFGAGLAGAGLVVAIAVGLTVNYLKAASQPPQPTPSPIASSTVELTAKELLDRGDTLFNQGKKQEAIALYDKSIALEPTNSAAYMSRGFARVDVDDKQGAIADYTKAIELDPKNSYSYSSRGNVRSDLNDKPGAIEDLNKAIALDPKDAFAYSSRGHVHVDLGDKQKAIADYTKAIELDPKSPYPYSSRGHVRRELGDKPGAIADWQKTASLYLAEGKTKDYQETLDKIKQIQQ
jgi:serine/threonine protein kinase/regulator of sirC expression with transglutaminase-like and TPR domain